MSVEPCFVSRRGMLGGALAFGLAPMLVPGAPPPHALAAAAESTPVARLWARAQALKAQMAPFAARIEAACRNGGTPGWMRLTGKANALGEARYNILIAILKSSPGTIDDLAIIARAAGDADIHGGPRAWAHGEFDRAASAFHRAA